MDKEAPLINSVGSVYLKRWWILAVFCLLSCSNAMVWNTFSPIANQSVEYFGVSVLAIDAFSLLFMVIYIPFVFLATYIINRRSLRFGIVTGALLNAIGTWIRYIAVMVNLSRINQYYVVLSGQTITAIAQAFILQIPPLIANNWFAPNERALATSIGALWNQLGIAIGFLISPLIVKSDSDIPIMLLIMGIMCTVTFILSVAGFESHPPTPPAVSLLVEHTSFKNSIGDLIRNRSFIILFFAFGMSVGAFYALTTLLSQMGAFANYSPVDCGWLGFIITVVGLFGAISGGFITDKFQKYKEILLFLYGGSFLSCIWFLFAITTRGQFISIAVCCAILGFFLTAILPPSLEAVVEVTYPVNEDFSSGLLLLSAQIFGIVFIFSMNELLTYKMVHESIDVVIWAFGLSVVGLVFLDTKYKRLERDKSNTVQ